MPNRELQVLAVYIGFTLSVHYVADISYRQASHMMAIILLSITVPRFLTTTFKPRLAIVVPNRHAAAYDLRVTIHAYLNAALALLGHYTDYSLIAVAILLLITVWQLLAGSQVLTKPCYAGCRHSPALSIGPIIANLTSIYVGYLGRELDLIVTLTLFGASQALLIMHSHNQAIIEA